MQQKKKWMRIRHRAVRNIAYAVLAPYSWWKYGITVQKFKQQGNRAYLILMNHQTAFDQFFVGMAFKGPIYYLASEDLFSNGWISALIRYLVAPIPIKKQTTDIQAVMNCIRIAKEGGTIAIAPEGNRTYSGKTEYMNPAIAPLVRKLHLPLLLFRIEGGYGVQPRWSDVVRKGKMRAYVSSVVEPQEYQNLSDTELLALIQDGLKVNEASRSGSFYHKKSAEYLERAIYVCPYCGLSIFESHDDTIECKKCKRQIQYLSTKELKGVGFDFPFQFVADWYDYQCEFINKLDTSVHIDTPLYRERARLSEVIVYKRKNILCKKAAITLFGDRITIDGIDQFVFLFNEVSAVTVLGRNKLNIYHDNKVYQLKGDKHFNALKYVNLFHRHRNLAKENQNGKFLGL